MEPIKEEKDLDVKTEAILRERDYPCSLWEGEVKVKLEKENREIQVPVQIFHKDDSKNGQKLFDWTIGKKSIISILNILNHIISDMKINLGRNQYASFVRTQELLTLTSMSH